MINLIRKHIAFYQLGKVITENLIDIKAFKSTNKKITLSKQNNYLPEYLGTVHTIEIIKHGGRLWKTLSMFKEDK